jgi:hypothetical protein
MSTIDFINSKAFTDFKVKYRFFAFEEGGRKSGAPINNYRSDWLYSEDKAEDGIYMIWPFFENQLGELISKDTYAYETGVARMHILVPEMKPLHQKRIKVGTKGYFMEGAHKVAEAEVIEIVNLFDKYTV